MADATNSRLEYECKRIYARARSLQIRGLAFRVEGNRVILEGEALTPDAVDSAVKLFATTPASEVVSRIRVAPAHPTRPGSILSPDGYVSIVELGPNAARLVETITWEVKPGDTLERIALSAYGDAAKVDRIRQANRNQLSPGDVIHAGQRLRLPPP